MVNDRYEFTKCSAPLYLYYLTIQRLLFLTYVNSTGNYFHPSLSLSSALSSSNFLYNRTWTKEPYKDIEQNHLDTFFMNVCQLQYLSKLFDINPVVLAKTTDQSTVEKIFATLQDIKIYVQFLDNMTPSEILHHLFYLRTHNFKFFALFCDFECTIKTLQTAASYTDLTGNGNIWLVLHHQVLLSDATLPSYLMRFNKMAEPYFGTLDTINKSCGIHHEIETNRLTGIEYLAEPRRWYSTTPIDLHLLSKVKPWNKKPKYKAVTILKYPYLILRDEKFGDECSHGHTCTLFETVNGTKYETIRCCYGLEIDLLEQLETDLSFESEIYIVEDNYFGAYVNGSWNGLVYDLQNHKADFALATLSITEARFRVIDFCEPFAEENSALLATAEEHRETFFNFNVIKKFSPSLWLVVLGGAVLISFALSFIEKYQSLGSQNTYPWLESISYLVSLYFGKDIGAKDPRVASARIISIVVAIATLVLVSTYTAVLTVDFVDKHLDYDFTGLRDSKLTNDGSGIRYGILASSAWLSFFRNSEDKDLQKIYTSSNKVEFGTLQEGIEMVKAGELDALINDETVLKGYACQIKEPILHVSKNIIKLIGMGIATPKESPLEKRLSRMIRTYKETGYLEKVQRKWIQTDCNAESNGIVDGMQIQGFGGAFVLLVLGIIVSIIILSCEIMFRRLYPETSIEQRNYKLSFWIR